MSPTSDNIKEARGEKKERNKRRGKLRSWKDGNRKQGERRVRKSGTERRGKGSGAYSRDWRKRYSHGARQPKSHN